MKASASLILTFIFLATSVFAQQNSTKFTWVNQASILQYLDEYGLEYDKADVAVFSLFDAWGYVVQTKRNEFPSAYFFNSKGENVKLRGESCSQELKKLAKINKAKINKDEDNISFRCRGYKYFL